MKNYDVVIVGGGFSGLSAALNLVRNGKKVHIIEKSNNLGGLASTFSFSREIEVEKFYHHWFNTDNYIIELIKSLKLEHNVIYEPSNTGIFFNNRIWKLSTPIELLKFTALPFFDRIRLGILIFYVRFIKNWKKIEHLTIKEWLKPICGENVYNVVWEPLIQSKFSVHSENISAVWMWKKLILRGGSRNKSGKESLAYYKGGFGNLVYEIGNFLEKSGSQISYNTEITNVEIKGNKIKNILSKNRVINGKSYLFTTSLPELSNIFQFSNKKNWLNNLQKVSYLANICLVLKLTKPLSEVYWLNINDPGFPFVGIIEHTNLDDPKSYDNFHIAYLSKYISKENPVWNYSDKEYFNYAIKHLTKIFPEFEKNLVSDYSIWRADYAQPITTPGYSKLLEKIEMPFSNSFLCTMAQIYPEDRGTNFAVRDGMKISKKIITHLNCNKGD